MIVWESYALHAHEMALRHIAECPICISVIEHFSQIPQ